LIFICNLLNFVTRGMTAAVLILTNPSFNPGMPVPR
jgi:hypothetical protein